MREGGREGVREGERELREGNGKEGRRKLKEKENEM